VKRLYATAGMILSNSAAATQPLRPFSSGVMSHLQKMALHDVSNLTWTREKSQRRRSS
jgi:hypothetical protein